MMVGRFHVVIAMILGVCITLGCRSSKKLTLDDGAYLSKKDIAAIIDGHNIDYSWYGIKGKVSISGRGESFSGSYYLRLKRDSIIWGLAKKLSVEGARVLITPEQATTLNRMDKTYTKSSFDALLETMGASMTFAEVQELLVGNIIPLGGNFKIKRDGVVQRAIGRVGELKVVYSIDPITKHIVEARYSPYPALNIRISMDDYHREDGVSYAKNKEISIALDGKEQAVIRWKIKDFSLNTPLKTPFKIPLRYERI